MLESIKNKLATFSFYQQLSLFRKGKTIVSNAKVISLPEGDCTDKKTIYSYYWFAEGIQYYHLQLEQVGGWFSNTKYMALGNVTWGFIPLRYDFDSYFQNEIKSAERALIRKAMKNGYTVSEINYDDYFDEITGINMSKAERMGHSMTQEYTQPVKRDAITKPYTQGLHTFGCFDSEHHLVAYYIFERFSNILHTMYGIGHADHLNMGIMNYLLAFSIAELSKMYPGLDLFYGTFNPESQIGLMKFKKHVGCIPYRIVYKGTKAQFQALEEFNRKYRLHNDSAVSLVTEYLSK